MNRHYTKTAGILLLAGAAILLAPQPVFASGDIKGSFDGKVVCQQGVKKAEFKSATLALSYSTAADIKRRIDAVTWPSSGDTLSFVDREQEKVQLQHALKLLKDLSCDEGATPTESLEQQQQEQQQQQQQQQGFGATESHQR